MKRNIYLIGMIGVGKSTAAKILAERLEWGFIDMDETVEAIYNNTIREIYDIYGEQAFRDMESNLLQEIAQGNHQVVACTEGIVKNENNLALIKSSGMLFWLEAPVETLVNRIKQSKYLFLIEDDIAGFLKQWQAERETLYRQSDVFISTVQQTPDEVARAIHKIAFESDQYQF
ncbi:MAG: shikimate kinase [Candidatus Neomarinimicrobiota bacterium]